MSDSKKEVYADSKFLYYFDIEATSPVTVTMTGTERIEAFNPGDKKKSELFSVRFKGAKKALGINKTNQEIIEQWHGRESDGWEGKQITLRVADCKGEKCIRVDSKPGCKLPSRYPRFSYLDKAKVTA